MRDFENFNVFDFEELLSSYYLASKVFTLIPDADVNHVVRFALNVAWAISLAIDAEEVSIAKHSYAVLVVINFLFFLKTFKLVHLTYIV